MPATSRLLSAANRNGKSSPRCSGGLENRRELLSLGSVPNQVPATASGCRPPRRQRISYFLTVPGPFRLQKLRYSFPPRTAAGFCSRSLKIVTRFKQKERNRQKQGYREQYAFGRILSSVHSAQ